MTVSRRELRASLSVQGVPTERIDALCGPERVLRARRTGPTPEGKVLRDAKAYLRASPIVAWFARINSGRIGQSKYSPYELFVNVLPRTGPLAAETPRESFTIVDIIGLLRDGRSLAIELKAGREEPSPQQSAFLRVVESHGGMALVAWGVDDLRRAGL